MRLQDITLTYKFDDTIIEALGVNTMRVYASGKNLYTWTKWSGWDPDVGSPVIRSVVLGVNVNF